MTWCDRLVCANCAGPVSEGRCSVCRAHRARMQSDGPLAALSSTALLAFLLAVIAVAVVAQRMTTA
ncbi:hypothetical protein [Streptomyces sp. Z26]|uniref:hypothetical protein n=1 Tax=Streptomyces TaxID=1883 RepID=UPI000EF138B9|nr:hypothetical protein [Streptomyces sp. Z26]RLL67133.1 hypothetical protein D7M15_09950 [Streptomyces sp. Z26]